MFGYALCHPVSNCPYHSRRDECLGMPCATQSLIARIAGYDVRQDEREPFPSAPLGATHPLPYTIRSAGTAQPRLRLRPYAADPARHGEGAALTEPLEVHLAVGVHAPSAARVFVADL